MSIGSNVTNTGVLDLANQVYKVEDLRQLKLTVKVGAAQAKTELIAYEKLSPAQVNTKSTSKFKNWVVSNVNGIKELITGEQGTLRHVSKKMDEVADALVSKFDHEIDMSLQPKLDEQSDDFFKDQISKISEVITKLNRVSENLYNHNQIIRDHNEHFIRKDRNLLACPKHNESLEKVNHKIVELILLKRELLEIVSEKKSEFVRLKQHEIKAIQLEKGKEVDKSLDELESNIENGLEIDREYIFTASSAFEKKLHELSPEKAEACKLRFSKLVNNAYLAALRNKIINKTIELPQSIRTVLAVLGYSDSWISIKLPLAKQSLMDSLLVKLNTFDLSKMSPIQLADQVLAEVFEFTGKLMGLNEEKEKNLSVLLKKLFEFESIWKSQEKQAVNISKEVLRETLTKNYGPGSPIENKPLLNHYLAQLSAYQPSKGFSKVLEQILKDQNFQKSMLNGKTLEFKRAVLNHPLQFPQLLRELDQLLTTQIASKEEDQMNYTLSIATEFNSMLGNDHDSWFIRNQKNQRFANKPDSLSDQRPLWTGNSDPINYRWIKAIMKNPSKLFKNASELSYKPVVRTEFEVVEDEFEVSDENQKNEAQNEKQGMPNAILNKDHLQKEIIISHKEPKTTLTALIEEVDTQNLKNEDSFNLASSNGVIDVTIMTEEKNEKGETVAYKNAHSIGIQIDRTSQLFRFWDIHSGLYTYSSLEELKAECELYVQSFYGSECNNFSATQYIDRDPSSLSAPNPAQNKAKISKEQTAGKLGIGTLELMALETDYKVTQDEMVGIRHYVSADYCAINYILRTAGRENRMSMEKLEEHVRNWYKAVDQIEDEESVEKMSAVEYKKLRADVIELKKTFVDQFGTVAPSLASDVLVILERIDLAINCLDKLPSFSNPDPMGETRTCRLLNTASIKLPTGSTLLEYYMASVGKVFTEAGFFSTSANLGGVDTLGEKDTVMYIRCPPGHSGKDISKISQQVGEREILFKPGSQFLVESVAKNKEGKYEIMLKAVVPEASRGSAG